ncbi:PLP-dependent aminotransferase family protein [Actinomadura rugatobispora]|uniref:PLP-dependent aminotransferase family protein n=1 Tax=Actinomadura rugatobispora TaxID=1994 RepID=A0ABW1ABK0_9ACTN|nr:PLP-dependent aminotransferase family protein [Actinomadura rugatobispora]
MGVTDLHLPLDRSAGRLAAQIAAGFRGAIRTGRLTAGTRLPSSRDLARDLEVSRGVVVTAYEQLIAEGFLVARRGDGTRVARLARPETPPPALPAPAATPTPHADPPGNLPYDLWPGTPDLGSFPRERWVAAVRASLRALPNDELTYPDHAGAPALRAELAGYLGRVRAAHTDPARVTIMSGVAHGMSAVVRALVDSGHRTLAVEDPTSVRQMPMLESTGIRLVRVPVDRHGIDVEALDRLDVRAVLVTPAHQYPTGVVLSPERRADLIAWARDVDGLVIEDDYDAEFRYDRDPVGCLQGVDPDRVVLLGSVSKALAPGLRLGWAAAPPELAERLRTHRAHTDLGAPVLDQHAFAHFMRTGGYDRHLRLMRRQYRARRDALVEALHHHVPGVTVRGVSAGIHLYVELPAGCDEDDVVATAARLGVAVAGAKPMWSRGRAPQAPPALVLGYARLNETRLTQAAELLGKAITQRALG